MKKQVAFIEIWWNREVRSWCIQMKNKNDEQVGESEYLYTKDEALRYASSLSRQNGWVNIVHTNFNGRLIKNYENVEV